MNYIVGEETTKRGNEPQSPHYIWNTDTELLVMTFKFTASLT